MTIINKKKQQQKKNWGPKQIATFRGQIACLNSLQNLPISFTKSSGQEYSRLLWFDSVCLKRIWYLGTFIHVKKTLSVIAMHRHMGFQKCFKCLSTVYFLNIPTNLRLTRINTWKEGEKRKNNKEKKEKKGKETKKKRKGKENKEKENEIKRKKGRRGEKRKKERKMKGKKRKGRTEENQCPFLPLKCSIKEMFPKFCSFSISTVINWLIDWWMYVSSGALLPHRPLTSHFSLISAEKRFKFRWWEKGERGGANFRCISGMRVRKTSQSWGENLNKFLQWSLDEFLVWNS